MYRNTLPTHPRTGLRALGIMPSGRIVWPILGGSGEGDGGGDGGAGGSTSGGDGSGGSYTPPASQAELDRIVQDRVRRATSKYGDYDTLKEKADKHDALQLELGTAADKAAAAARDEERTKANGHWTPRVVRAEFKAAAKGVLTDEQRDALLEDLDLSKYVDKDGEPDADKINKKVKAFAPAGDTKGGGSRTPINLGQGNQPPAVAKKGDAGRAMAERRFGKTA